MLNLGTGDHTRVGELAGFFWLFIHVKSRYWRSYKGWRTSRFLQVVYPC